MRKSLLSDIVPLVGAIALSQAAGILGSFATVSQIPTWYAGLDKPPLNPPGWVFGPVWTLLYTLMGIAAFLIWRNHRSSKQGKRALMLFGAQLVMNTAWSLVFFGAHNIGGAVVVIVLLWCLIGATIVSFARLSRAAAWLLVPYLLWVSFATYLNVALFVLNS